MKKILLLTCTISFILTCVAQQKELDSLSTELKKHPRQDTLRLKLLLDITYAYEQVSPDKGIQTGSEAVKLAKKLNAKKLLASAYMYMAQNYQTLGKDSATLDLCNQSLLIRKELKDSAGMGNVYQTMGESYSNFSDYYTAISYQQQALDIAKKMKNKSKEADRLNNIGMNYQLLGDYPKALQYLQNAIIIWEQAGKQESAAYAFTNMGLMYKNTGDYAKALEYHNKALVIYENAGNMINAADCYGNIAVVYDLQGNQVNSRSFYRQSLEMSRKALYDKGITSSQVNLGISYINTNDFDSGLKYLIPAYQNLKKGNNKTALAIVLDYLSYCYIEAPDAVLKKYKIQAKNKLDKALELQMQSIDISLKNHRNGIADAYRNLSDIYAAKKDYLRALGAYKKSVDYKDSILNDDKKREIIRLEMQFAFNKKQDSTKAVTDKKQALASAEIQKQHIIKNSTMAGAGFLLIAGTAGFVFYKRSRDIKTQKNEAELKAQVSDTEMKALRAQMNPHFIFNSLNSITDYIDKHQTQTASDFTTKFARLMRMVLENSERKEIPLADDLRALELYMQLESFRLKNKFSYAIHIDEDIDQINTLVPPLILQPFVENSIWHGIAKKDGQGSIKIFIKKQGQNINCIVEDDGAGIPDETAAQDKTSLGMKITKARIDIINKLKNANASMQVTNKEKGVRAEVALPLVLAF